MLPPANQLADAEDYAGRLAAAAGYSDVDVKDLTGRSRLLFCERMRGLFPRSDAQITSFKEGVSCYLLASARKPGPEPES